MDTFVSLLECLTYRPVRTIRREEGGTKTLYRVAPCQQYHNALVVSVSLCVDYFELN